jgi:lactaldehyde reductase
MILNETAYFGKDAVKQLTVELKNRNLQRVLVVTDSELVKCKVTAKVTKLLVAGRIVYQIYDKVKANPTVSNVNDGVEMAKLFRADVIVAVGGGSVIDTAKAIAILMANTEITDVRKLEGVSPTKHKALPLIAITTTSGTAAEVTINYVITDEDRQRKFVCVDVHDIPLVAIIDPELSSTMPAKLCAATGMDALVHAIEGYITKGAWELTDFYCLKAIEIISENLRAAVKGGEKAREQMAYGQYIAGMGFSNCGLGIVHSMAHPLSAVYDIPHGVACAVLLAPVMKFNASATGSKYRDIAAALGVKTAAKMSQAAYRKAAITAVEKLAKDVGIPAKLREFGVQAHDIDFLADSALKDACTPGNPQDVTKKKLIDIYKSVL